MLMHRHSPSSRQAEISNAFPQDEALASALKAHALPLLDGRQLCMEVEPPAILVDLQPQASCCQTALGGCG